MTKIKICGLKRPEDIQAVNLLRPDYCGFILEYPKSFRCITRQRLRQLAKDLDPAVTAVGVFVNAPVEIPAELQNEGLISIVQLHGQEDDEYIIRLKSLTGNKPVIKAFSMRTREDARRADISSADYILLDQGGGGTGKTFDWSLIPKFTRPFFLAGGLGADNIEDAIRRIRPYGVDLSSSLETDGVKDPKKMKEIVDIVRSI